MAISCKYISRILSRKPTLKCEIIAFKWFAHILDTWLINNTKRGESKNWFWLFCGGYITGYFPLRKHRGAPATMWSIRGAQPECQQSFVACWPARGTSFHRCPPTEPQHVYFTFPGAPPSPLHTLSPTPPLKFRSFERSSPANTESQAATCAPWPAWLPSWRRRAFTSTCCRLTSPRDRSPSARVLKGRTREATSTRKDNNKNDNATYHKT